MNILKSRFNAETFTDYIHQRLSVFLKFSLSVGALLMFFQGRYQAMAEILLILFISFLPIILGKRFDVRIPHGFETLAVIFLYMSLFLGETQSYYTRFWWWDLVLHSGSAFLLGILGFLMVYVLNERKDVDLDMKPKFIALFAFLFAVSIGALWEIFEYAMDQIFGLNMQKSGLQDTMWDLIVDVAGAAFISILGWGYINNREEDSFLERWIRDFVEKNPRLFEDGETGKE
jgi:uncharacterized membrane protein YjdF